MKARLRIGHEREHLAEMARGVFEARFLEILRAGFERCDRLLANEALHHGKAQPAAEAPRLRACRLMVEPARLSEPAVALGNLSAKHK